MSTDEGDPTSAGIGVELRSDVTVTLIQAMATDEHFARAARRSSKQYDKTGGAGGLINSLIAHRHGSPFEHSGMTIEVEAPIFVAREWMRHRVPWGYSELSGRYSELDPVFWIPEEDRGLINVGSSMRPQLAGGDHEAMIADLQVSYGEAWRRYRSLLEQGYAREVARACLPVAIFTNFWATANARGIMHFLSLRVEDPEATFTTHPMYEIDAAARQLETLFAGQWPLTHKAFVKNGRVCP